MIDFQRYISRIDDKRTVMRRRCLVLGLLILSFLLLSGCAYRHASRLPATQENWASQVETNPQRWMRGADEWFTTGNPNVPKYQANPYRPPIATMSMRVAEFTKIKVNGTFQVQLFSTDGPSSVYIYGPNDGVRATLATSRGGVLCVSQIKKAPRSMPMVVVRIGVNHLTGLLQLGRSRIEGIQINTDQLSVTSLGTGNIYLSGNMNLVRVDNFGHGCINIFGANTPTLDIRTNGSNVTNISGNVGIRSIINQGQSYINIIGANSNFLRIYASGSGKVGISGIVNLRELRASGHARVFICKLMTTGAYVRAANQARIGLAGSAQNISINATDSSCVLAKDLCTDTAYVRTQQHAHVNISACNKIYASASGSSSIYFFGSPTIMTQFVGGNSIVMPIWNQYSNVCPIAAPPPVYQPMVPYRRVPRNFPGEG